MKTIELIGGGPRDGAIIQVPDDMDCYYDVFDQDKHWWYRYCEILFPRSEPSRFLYIGCRPDIEWWHK